MNKKLLLFFKLFFSIALILFVFRNIDLSLLFKGLSNSNLWLLIPAVFVILSGYVISAWRFKLILKECAKKFSFAFAFKYTLIGNFFNNYLPGSVAGDIYRVYTLRKSGTDKIFSIYSIILEKIIGIFSIILLVSILFLFTDISLPAYLSSLMIILSLFLGFGIIFFILIFLFRKKIEKIIIRNKQVNRNKWANMISKVFSKIFQVIYSIKKESYIKIFFISVFYQAIVLLFNYIVLYAVGINLNIKILFPVVTLYVILTVLPISYNGVGIREYILMFFLKEYGVIQEQIALFGIFVLVLNLVTALIGGYLYIGVKSEEKSK